MIRYSYINNKVLKIYSALPSLSFPIDVYEIINIIPNCKYMSYQDFAKINNCSIKDVIQICESESGCTHYDVSKDRYLILSNQSFSSNNNIGRQRWTCGHEIGHTICGHLALSAYNKLSENNFLDITNPEFESEADYFAATLLSPFPLFELLGINSPIDIQKCCGLSTEASLYRFKQYLKWSKSHYKSSWEYDLKKIYLNKTTIL